MTLMPSGRKYKHESNISHLTPFTHPSHTDHQGDPIVEDDEEEDDANDDVDASNSDIEAHSGEGGARARKRRRSKQAWSLMPAHTPDAKVKIALSLYKVQQNIYLLDFQRVEVSVFFFQWVFGVVCWCSLCVLLLPHFLLLLNLLYLPFSRAGRCLRVHETVRLHHHGAEESVRCQSRRPALQLRPRRRRCCRARGCTRRCSGPRHIAAHRPVEGCVRKYAW